MKSPRKCLAEDTKVLDPAVAKRLVSRSMVLAIVGVALSAAAAVTDTKRLRSRTSPASRGS